MTLQVSPFDSELNVTHVGEHMSRLPILGSLVVREPGVGTPMPVLFGSVDKLLGLRCLVNRFPGTSNLHLSTD